MDSYLDGLGLFQSPRFATPRIDPYLLERIDVLYGPSSVLYGQGSPGGLVNYSSKLPIDTPYHEIMTQIGNHDNRSEEHTSELQSPMRNSSAVFRCKKKK